MNDSADNLHASAGRVYNRANAKNTGRLAKVRIIRCRQLERRAVGECCHFGLRNCEENSQRSDGGDPEKYVSLLHLLSDSHGTASDDASKWRDDP